MSTAGIQAVSAWLGRVVVDLVMGLLALIGRQAGRLHFPVGERHDRLLGSKKHPIKVSLGCHLVCSSGSPYRFGSWLACSGERGTRAVPDDLAPLAWCSTVEDCLQCLATALARSGVVCRLCTEGSVVNGRHPIRPVLKHGPRSLTCAQVKGSC